MIIINDTDRYMVIDGFLYKKVPLDVKIVTKDKFVLIKIEKHEGTLPLDCTWTENGLKIRKKSEANYPEHLSDVYGEPYYPLGHINDIKKGI